MKSLFTILSLSLSLLATAAPTVPGPDAPIQTVLVGADNTLTFNPPVIQVARGSRVHFDFVSGNHTLTETTLDNPCKKLQGTDVDTDFNNVNFEQVPNLHPFDYTFASDQARFFYSKQGAGSPECECGKGMVFAVNVHYKTFEYYRRKSMTYW